MEGGTRLSVFSESRNTCGFSAIDFTYSEYRLFSTQVGRWGGNSPDQLPVSFCRPTDSFVARKLKFERKSKRFLAINYPPRLRCCAARSKIARSVAIARTIALESLIQRDRNCRYILTRGKKFSGAYLCIGRITVRVSRQATRALRINPRRLSEAKL